MHDWLLLAQEQPQPAPLMQLLMPMLLIFAFFWFLIIRPQRREQQRKEQMLAALKKNDRVVTIGGMVGTVANISSDGREVTLKVDDDTRIRFLRGSIQGLYADDSESPSTTS